MKFFVMLAVSLMFSVQALSAAKVGSKAPQFASTDVLAGESFDLKAQKGKWVVLEWYNKDCPYVKKHYGSGNMQKLQSKYTEKGVQWVTIISSAEGKQGHFASADVATKVVADHGIKASAMILDPSGMIGKKYGAKTTPHMYVINPEGQLVYNGAIDDNDSANPAVIKDSKNYIVAALDQGMSGQAIKKSSTTPYGCSVKY